VDFLTGVEGVLCTIGTTSKPWRPASGRGVPCGWNHMEIVDFW